MRRHGDSCNHLHRASTFVTEWQKRAAKYRSLEMGPSADGSNKARAGLVDMAKSLHRDPQLESLLENRRAQLGLDALRGKTLSQDLQLSLGSLRAWVSRCRLAEWMKHMPKTPLPSPMP